MGTNLGIIAPTYNVAKVRVLEKDVEGMHCVVDPGFNPDQQRTPYGDFGIAIGHALEKVPGSNVLVNVTFTFEQRLSGEVCRVVVGDAGVLN